MIENDEIEDLVSLLESRNACLWHACNFMDFRTYLVLGGVPSRATMEQSGLSYTGFETDQADHDNGVWDKVFVNLSDFGEAFARGFQAVPNAYGPIVLQIRPQALGEASDVAICLRSAGARDFDRNAEALPSVNLVNELFRFPVSTTFPQSAQVRFGQDLLAVFPKAASSNPEVSCSVPQGFLSLSHVVMVWTDPYEIDGITLLDQVQEALHRRGIELPVRDRSCMDDSRRAMYGELVNLVSQGHRSLGSIQQVFSASEPLRNWARDCLKNDIDYNFKRFANYLFEGTLQPIFSRQLPNLTVPTESYADKFSKIMALKRQATPEAAKEIATALDDDDENIRWLAGSTLQAMEAVHAKNAMETLVERTQSEAVRKEVENWMKRMGWQESTATSSDKPTEADRTT